MDTLLSANGRAIPVTVVDLSRSGIRVHANSRIDRGTSVRVECEELIGEGVVWHSRRFKGAYSIGIEFQRISRAADKNIPSNHRTHMGNAERIYAFPELEVAAAC